MHVCKMRAPNQYVGFVHKSVKWVRGVFASSYSHDIRFRQHNNKSLLILCKLVDIGGIWLHVQKKNLQKINKAIKIICFYYLPH